LQSSSLVAAKVIPKSFVMIVIGWLRDVRADWKPGLTLISNSASTSLILCLMIFLLAMFPITFSLAVEAVSNTVFILASSFYVIVLVKFFLLTFFFSLIIGSFLKAEFLSLYIYFSIIFYVGNNAVFV